MSTSASVGNETTATDDVVAEIVLAHDSHDAFRPTLQPQHLFCLNHIFPLAVHRFRAALQKAGRHQEPRSRITPLGCRHVDDGLLSEAMARGGLCLFTTVLLFLAVLRASTACLSACVCFNIQICDDESITETRM